MSELEEVVAVVTVPSGVWVSVFFSCVDGLVL
jgi:hypothetical protein